LLQGGIVFVMNWNFTFLSRLMLDIKKETVDYFFYKVLSEGLAFFYMEELRFTN